MNETHFDCVAENLVATLDSLNVPKDISDDVVAAAGPMRSLFEDAAKNVTREQSSTEQGM